MKISSILALGLTAAALTTAGACGGSASGRLALGIKDGPPTSSDGRTIKKLEIDITRIELKPHGDNQSNQTGAHDDKAVVVLDVGTAPAYTIDLLQVTTFAEMVASCCVMVLAPPRCSPRIFPLIAPAMPIMSTPSC